MLRIVGHIEHLLSVHDCVIVPDFGGFVVQTLPVRYDAGMHRFEPMRKDIVFNETLQYNDGLLIEAYMQAEKTDYRTARQLMHEDVALLRAGLQRDGVLKMENIGSFSMGEEGQLIFQADEAGWLNAPMLGLEDFTFEPLSEQMPEAMALPEKKKAEIYYIPVSRRLVRVVAATAASVALFLAFQFAAQRAVLRFGNHQLHRFHSHGGGAGQFAQQLLVGVFRLFGFHMTLSFFAEYP